MRLSRWHPDFRKASGDSHSPSRPPYRSSLLPPPYPPALYISLLLVILFLFFHKNGFVLATGTATATFPFPPTVTRASKPDALADPRTVGDPGLINVLVPFWLLFADVDHGSGPNEVDTGLAGVPPVQYFPNVAANRSEFAEGEPIGFFSSWEGTPNGFGPRFPPFTVGAWATGELHGDA